MFFYREFYSNGDEGPVRQFDGTLEEVVEHALSLDDWDDALYCVRIYDEKMDRLCDV